MNIVGASMSEYCLVMNKILKRLYQSGHGSLFLKGFCVGAVDIIPGVSGGTMAFILGIYNRLLQSIRAFDWIWLCSIFRWDIKTIFHRPDFGFLIPLGFGAFCALLFFTRIVSLPNLIRSKPELIYGLFFGLIVGSTIAIFKREARPLNLPCLVFIVLGTVVGWVCFNLVPAETPETSWFIFICGVVAISAMLLPGLSGSFLLLILKKYAYIFDAIGCFNWAIILPFGAGMVIGVVLFSRFVSWLLSRFYQPTIMFILGLLLASLWVIWPFQERRYIVVRGSERLISSTPIVPSGTFMEGVLPIFLIFFGVSCVWGLDRCAKRLATH